MRWFLRRVEGKGHDTSQRLSETVPVERKATSHHNADPDDMSGFDKMHAPENFGVDNPPEISEDLRSESLVKQPLPSMVTPEKIKMEISRLKRQEEKLQDNISTLRKIQEVVSKKGRRQGP
ncbi:hypothetical protein R1sor_014535 [Riccia sorocarpa]|uniref:Uncharacterized protein n=1 Tax=Riccia sorocarpa TaxID=122646 RepID=A0ABD3HDX5_9MARC